jgi:hypothetical protein
MMQKSSKNWLFFPRFGVAKGYCILVGGNIAGMMAHFAPE